MLKALAKDGRYWLRNELGSHAVTFPMLRAVPRFRDRLTDRGIDLCIDGFPRSANSFTTRALRVHNPQARLAHHVHVPMQLLRAAKLGIPAILLVREPVATLSSLLIVDKDLSVRLAVRSWIRFYREVWPARDEVVVSDFHRSIHAFDEVVRDVNAKWGTAFQMPRLDEKTREEIFAALDAHHKRVGHPEALIPYPTAEKEARKAQVLDAIRREPATAEATRLYQAWTGGGA